MTHYYLHAQCEKCGSAVDPTAYSAGENSMTEPLEKHRDLKRGCPCCPSYPLSPSKLPTKSGFNSYLSLVLCYSFFS
jgi:hypothetical protein